MGMLGTVIGLINMLGNLSDPDQLGIGMSLALLTTLYGVLFANVVFLPVAGKLENLNAQELKTMELVVEGVSSIQNGASPRMLVERLEAWLDPARRVGYQARAKGGSAAA
jgi:chemotaxis protein MotA